MNFLFKVKHKNKEELQKNRKEAQNKMSFFKEDEIEEVLKCLHCNLKLNDPRVLTCGHTFCNDCLQSESNQKSVKCFECGKFTMKSVDCEGFLENFTVAKMLQKSSFEVYRGEAASILKENIASIRQPIKKVSLSINVANETLTKNVRP